MSKKTFEWKKEQAEKSFAPRRVQIGLNWNIILILAQSANSNHDFRQASKIQWKKSQNQAKCRFLSATPLSCKMWSIARTIWMCVMVAVAVVVFSCDGDDDGGGNMRLKRVTNPVSKHITQRNYNNHRKWFSAKFNTRIRKHSYDRAKSLYMQLICFTVGWYKHDIYDTHTHTHAALYTLLV